MSKRVDLRGCDLRVAVGVDVGHTRTSHAASEERTTSMISPSPGSWSQRYL
jgi:hypothetical protein